MSTPQLLVSPHVHHPAHTPMVFVQCVVQAYQQRGMDAGGALAAAQIAPAQLHDAQARITALQMEVLCAHAMRELGDEALGWVARPLPWGSYGLLARASISSPTLGLAMARWCRHHGLLAPEMALQLHTDGRNASVQLRLPLAALATAPASSTPGAATPIDMQVFCTVSVLRNLHGFASWLVDARLPLHSTHFAFDAPTYSDALVRLFDGPVRFGAPVTCMEFDAQWLQLPLVRDEAALSAMLQRALPLQVRPYKPAQPLVQRVRQALATDPHCQHTAATLAALLHMAPRTLHRQLRQQGTSVQQLKDDVRRHRALHLLARTDMPIKRVAQACGFANEKSFMRAFHHWTGTAPGAHRQALRHAAAATTGAPASSPAMHTAPTAAAL